MGLRLTAVTLCMFGVAQGCGPDRTPIERAAMTELVSPADEGSGEPFLSSAEDGVYLSWLQRTGDRGHELRFARWSGEDWSPAQTIATRDDFFVNWADFPSVIQADGGTLWAHWLQREQGPGLAYGVRVTWSGDGGRTWSAPSVPHEDGTPTEHGFVSILAARGGGVELVWLDGRKYAPGPNGEPAAQEMSVRARAAGVTGFDGPEIELDGRTCDCCQTDAAMSADGPVVVYRDRTPDEIRDIHLVRKTAAGWSDPIRVHEDAWKVAGCPVNGPAVDARGERVAVAWFTAAGDQPRVFLAFSEDSGRSFAEPVRVDGGNPAGRVDVRLDPEGRALVSWIERLGGEQAEVRVAAVERHGRVGRPVSLPIASAGRASGFPRMVGVPGESTQVLVAWTDVADVDRPRVRVARLEVSLP